MNSVRSAYLEPLANCHIGAMKWSLFLTLFTTLAVGLPYVCHQFGLAGVIFLPMHFAVFFAALVMGLRGGVAVALLSPSISYLTSAMPPVQSLFPTTVELITYAVVINIASRKMKLPVVLSLLLAMIAGRAVSLLLISAILQKAAFSVHLKSVFVIGLPGIIIQLALLPVLASAVSSFLERK